MDDIPRSSVNTGARVSTYREIQYQAQKSAVHWYERLFHYFKHHGQCIQHSIVRQLQTPISSLLTYSVIAIAMTLPALLYVFAQGSQQLVSSWSNNLQINVFTHKSTSPQQIRQITKRVEKHPLVEQVRWLTPQQALAEYQQLNRSQVQNQTFAGANPFPHVLILKLKPQLAKPDAINALVRQLKSSGQTHTIVVDKDLITRLTYLIDIGKRLMLVLICVLGIGVLLIVGNTIRLEILNRQDEIIVVKLIGAKDSYIRRPLLYSGFWYGLIGGALACLITLGIILYLQTPIKEFLHLQASAWTMTSTDVGAIGLLIGLSAVLGWLGSWIASLRHLRQIEPR